MPKPGISRLPSSCSIASQKGTPSPGALCHDAGEGFARVEQLAAGLLPSRRPLHEQGSICENATARSFLLEPDSPLVRPGRIHGRGNRRVQSNGRQEQRGVVDHPLVPCAAQKLGEGERDLRQDTRAQRHIRDRHAGRLLSNRAARAGKVGVRRDDRAGQRELERDRLGLLPAREALAGQSYGGEIPAAVLGVTQRARGRLRARRPARAGRLHLLRQMPEKDTVSWTSIIQAYAQNGHTDEAFDLFHRMLLEGDAPDEVTFFGILGACGHNGLTERARAWFVAMSADFGVVPVFDHYCCLINVVGTAGKLELAQEMLRSVRDGLAGGEDESVAWTTLLAASKIHGDVELARAAAKNACGLETRGSSPYMLLSHVEAIKS
ncbi:pentatricopeptide repeat-containing protein At3g57430, chloroplastic [Selaginella moellendorffii]|uniref:pentatricopeptide repeat-containing protein At3g57430, chloroplastic n=1 Tax=Selaginella moellendorffii TaxID=88036 RepID=UPI000D1C4B4C|nr:pentatricopeptide repeat-containing protein At3g57430, chloroplastic [Selaginella moellendorffii]|eukprot:XP_024534576.1 pentatricopeptide repeat-containing protein At3g57430, chloroplastic [Selaginella moellendorffii]